MTTPSGSSPSTPSKPSGAPRNASVLLGLIPSLRASGLTYAVVRRFSTLLNEDTLQTRPHRPEETQHEPIHGRLPVRQRPNRGVGTPIPGRPLPLSRLPQASWGPFSRFRRVPRGCGDDRRRDTRLRRAVLLSPLRL